MTKRMLLVCHGYPFETIGGVGQVIEQLVEHLPNLGWEVHVLVPNPSTWSTTIHIETTPTVWGSLHILHRPIRRWSEAWNSPAANQFLLNWVNTLMPSVIHVHHVNALPWQWLIRNKQKSSTRLWITLHDYALPCARGQLLNNHLQVCNGPTIEVCLSCINPWLRLDGWKRKGLSLVHNPASMITARLESIDELLHACDYIDAPSRNMIRQFQRLYPNIQIEHCELPMPKLKHIQQQSLDRDPVRHRFLFVGSIHPSKGVDILLRAFKEVKAISPDIELTIIGPSVHNDVYPKYSAIWEDYAKHLDGTRWMGSLSHEEAMEQMAAHDTLVLPSVWKENSPIVVREALQRGLHIVCGRGGSNELSTDIIQITPLSVFQLKQGMTEVLKRPSPSPIVYPAAINTVRSWIQCAMSEEQKGH